MFRSHSNRAVEKKKGEARFYPDPALLKFFA